MEKNEEKSKSSLLFPLFLFFFNFSRPSTMLSTKGKPAPVLPSSALLSAKLKQASLENGNNDDASPAADAAATVTTTAAAPNASGGGGGVEERQEMKQFWEEHSKTATVEEMMLDSKASEIDLQERPEVRRRRGSGGAAADGADRQRSCQLLRRREKGNNFEGRRRALPFRARSFPLSLFGPLAKSMEQRHRLAGLN